MQLKMHGTTSIQTSPCQLFSIPGCAIYTAAAAFVFSPYSTGFQGRISKLESRGCPGEFSIKDTLGNTSQEDDGHDFLIDSNSPGDH